MPKANRTKWRGFASMSAKDKKDTATMGGLAVVEKYGRGHMRDIAKIAVKARKKAARARRAAAA